jgi:hypothetical protein
MSGTHNCDYLLELIRNPDAGLLLDAEIDYDVNGKKVHRSRAAFHLTLGEVSPAFHQLVGTLRSSGRVRALRAPSG